MGKLLLAFFILCAAVGTLARPWIGVASYYLLAILGPQYIWWWNFQGLRVSLIVALSVIASVGMQALKGRYDTNFIFNRQNLWLGALWFFIILSYFFGPYVSRFSFDGLGPAQLFSITNTIFLFYFIASLEMNEFQKLRYLGIIFIVSTIYLIYWANYQYLSQNWIQFNYGRLMGPTSAVGGSIYGDENAFAMLFVCGVPFIYYIGWESKKNWLRWGLWATIPLGWHAVFLTGSRGGLVGLTVSLVIILLTSRRKFLVLPLLLFFLLFYQWQAGDVMEKRSGAIVNIQGERSASDRIIAWEGGLKMTLSHPITGVGLGSFRTALPDYIESRNMVAHNTFIQFAAESGVGAGLAYLAVVLLFFKHSLYIRRWCRTADINTESHRIDLYNNASTTSFAGLTVCGLFLSLNVFELFFLLLLFNNALYQICSKNHHSQV